MGTDCKSAAFSFGGSNPPAPTKKTSVENTLVFCFARHLKSHSRGWIRTAAALSQKTAQKQPSGLFLAARLAQSTRAHQELQYPNRVLEFLFCRKFSGLGGWIRTATATTAASGRNREELLGLRPAGCACRPRHDAAAGSRDPGSLYSAARVIHPRPPRTPVSEPGTGVSVYLPHKRDARATRKIHSSPRRYCIYPRPVIPYR